MQPVRHPSLLLAPTLLIYGTGVLAAFQLGKFAALTVTIQEALGLSLAATALLTSLLELGGALGGGLAGRLLARRDPRRALTIGVALLAAGSIGQAIAPGFAALAALRVLESGGYLIVVVAAPTILAHEAADRAGRERALALWSTFVPVGFALGAALTAIAGVLLSWRGILAANGVAAALVALLVWWRLGRRAAKAADAAVVQHKLPRRVLLAVASFFCFTMFEVGLLALLPAYLQQAWQLSADRAGLVTGVAAASAVGGGLIAGMALRHGWNLVRVLTLALLGCAAAFLVNFPAATDGGAAQLAAVCTAAVLINLLSGVLPGAVFARLPSLLQSPAGIAAANGILAQAGASGSLLGPPLFGLVAQTAGWPGVGWCGAALSVASLAWFAVAFGKSRIAAHRHDTGVGHQP